MYMITVFGNLLIILAASSDPHLHTPMYFFLANLSLVDICFTSTTIPKMLWNIQTQNKVITYAGCITQMYFFIIFAGIDAFFPAVMAYDQFVAICHPLYYIVFMNPQLRALRVLVSWTMSALNSLLQSLMVLWLSFCILVEISHFFYMLLVGNPLTGILYSYFKKVSSILGISSSQGKYKALSTCASHLLVVSLFYCISLRVYLSSASTQSSHTSAVTSAMYTVATPMLNPLIYSLRNRDIKRAPRRIIGIPVM
ncbi:unnamed protein product [Gulo gulo]|uniref:G-protein coupled receptors family 1 profile domain-containing protein n=1 Tax=Gulo gulo TaxID=48420 RepID=A0A9X9LCI4_GULGU|nr:unnamed protein product [Gulo gulo]